MLHDLNENVSGWSPLSYCDGGVMFNEIVTSSEIGYKA